MNPIRTKIVKTTFLESSPRFFTSHQTKMSNNCPKNYIGPLLFLATPILLSFATKRMHSTKTNRNNLTYSSEEIKNLVASMESIVQRDEGKRRIGEILLPSGELYNAAYSMVNAKTVAIITGFPCMLNYDPPTETDGPLGALALAKCLLALGKNVVIATDECNEEVLLRCAAVTNTFKQSNPNNTSPGTLTMESFPGQASFDIKDERRLQQLADRVDLVIAIERSGPCQDGRYLTMRGFDMTHLLAPLELMLMPPGILEEIEEGQTDSSTVTDKEKEGANSKTSVTDIKREKTPPRSIGIGDGGNEIGMGKIHSRVIGSSITNAAEIACVVPTDHLLVCSVSNWGGYALAAAAAVVDCATRQQEGQSITHKQLHEQLLQCLPSDTEETAKCTAIVSAGARDGVTGKLECWVDGMPLETSLQVLRELRDI